MANIIYIATSLDGFIAGTDGDLEWLNNIPNTEGGDYGFAEFMRGIDAILMGRNTFEAVLSFGVWPYRVPVFVLSRQLTNLPADMVGKAEIISGDVQEIVNRLNQQGLTNIYVDGGATIQSFLAEDLIDALIVTRVPIVLGAGIPLFGNLDQPLKFRHYKTEILNNSLVKSHYVRDR